jgi:LmbE family N-acetylglucosaminyl deacetylase
VKPFGVDGVEPARWLASPWWTQAPSLQLPPRDTHLVVLAAHPDDETLGAGGLLHAAASRLDRTTVVIASDGAASHANSPTHTSIRLAEMRRDETAAALQVLSPGAELVQLGLPDGRLADQLPAIIDRLDEVLGADTDAWLLSTWLYDGHPDHATTALAARAVAKRRSRTRLFEYPIWFWHIADPDHVAPSFEKAVRRFDLAPSDRQARADAIERYPSQVHDLSDRAGDEALLPKGFLAHFDRDREFLLAVGPAPAARTAYFDELYADSPDPWQLATSWYEQRKRALLMAALPRARFRHGFEPGCARGDLSELLRHRTDDLLCADASPAAVAATRDRLPLSVRVEQLRIPEQWPSERFDLIVLSEVGYYVPDLAGLADRISQTLDDDGVLVLVHWRRAAPDHPHTAETVHATLHSATGLARLAHHEEDDFLLDVLGRDRRSVAQRQGLVV